MFDLSVGLQGWHFQHLGGEVGTERQPSSRPASLPMLVRGRGTFQRPHSADPTHPINETEQVTGCDLLLLGPS